ncbi:MAG: DUF4080 domain-containing protein [Negativicutes bacterium]|jgi:radical SAM superfamily enzyme YgiQ (UPF0313 family)
MQVLLTTLNAKYIHSSLALRNLKSYCQSMGSEIDVREYTINNTLLDILADLFVRRPQIIGFACYIWNIDMTLKLADLVKKVMPDVRIILGGPEVSYDPLSILKSYNCIDYIILGEGEETFRELVKALLGKGDVYSIAGLAFRGKNGELIEGCSQVVEELDSIPFAYNDTDKDELGDKIIYYESSRGCPFSCQYCLSSVTAGVRYYSLARVFKDLQYFVDHNVRQVKFVDRTFNANKQHYLPILKFLAKQECRTNFHFEIAADILDDEVIEFLKTVPKGRFQFEVGIQSTNEQTLNEIRRNNNWPKIVSTVSKVLSYGNIHMHLDLIVGLPYEDMDKFRKSFNDIFKLAPDMLQIGFLKLLKGSGVRNRAQQHGYIYMDIPPYEVLSNKYMGYNEFRELKLLEDLFNHLYNSGRFRRTLPFLINEKFDGDAFVLFRSLTAYWESNGLHMKAQSVKSLFEHIKGFCARILDNKQFKSLLDLLKFDALMSDNGNIRPEFLSWNYDKWNDEKSAFWRNEMLAKKYLPQYRFTTWRDIKKKYHIEVFETKLPDYMNFLPDCEGKSVILFDYTNSEPEYQQLNQEDFWPEGG